MNIKAHKEGLIKDTVLDLLKANGTVTTLEVKVDLRAKHSEFYWSQQEVSSYMTNMASSGTLGYSSTGSYRIYTYSQSRKVNKVKRVAQTNTYTAKSIQNPITNQTINLSAGSTSKVYLSRPAALNLIKNNKGHYFTVTFTKLTDGTKRVLNCQYSKDLNKVPSDLVKVKAGSGKGTKSFDINTVTELKIAGATYSIQ